MNREILFRAKGLNGEGWVFGFYAITGKDTDIEKHLICTSTLDTNSKLGRFYLTDIEVDKNTVCQFSGITDKNENKIFEGDDISFTNKNLAEMYFNQKTKIEYSNCAFWLVFESSKTALSLVVRYDKYELEIMGNKYE